MKQVFFFLMIVMISINSIAQGNSHGKANGKEKNKHADEINKSNGKSNENSTQPGYTRHQPKKVAAALLRDYPGATNVNWNKYKGDYTATFNNGVWRSTAVYHANGERRDTRTVLTREQLPGSVWDRIFKRDNITPTQYIQIERPSTVEKIFRILSSNNRAYYYDENGNKVTYLY